MKTKPMLCYTMYEEQTVYAMAVTDADRCRCSPPSQLEDQACLSRYLRDQCIDVILVGDEDELVRDQCSVFWKIR